MKIEEVKYNLNRMVTRKTRDGIFSYLFTGCILRKDEKGYFYQAELQDVGNKNSVVICRLYEIEERVGNDEPNQNKETAS